MKIKRQVANRILSRAVESDGRCVMGVLDAGDKLLCADDADHANQLLLDNQPCILVYNQSPDARDMKNRLQLQEGQYSIEIFQDIEGVFGLRGYCQQGKLQIPVELVLDT